MKRVGVACLAVLLGLIAFASGSRAQPVLSDHAFIMPPIWVIMPGQEIRNGNLMFRRFSLALQKSNFDEARAKGGGVEAIGPAGTLFNTMLYVCPRTRTDHLTFHMPDQVGLASFRRDEWVSSLPARILADGSSVKFGAEYIKGDLFVDADGSGHLKDFLDVLNATDIVVEFGAENDRFHLFVGDIFASIKLSDFLRGALPMLLQKKPATFKFLSTAQMLKACANYKKTGKY